MGFVRTRFRVCSRVSNRSLSPRSGDRISIRTCAHSLLKESTLLDIIYVLGIIAVFVVVGLIARGVEKL